MQGTMNEARSKRDPAEHEQAGNYSKTPREAIAEITADRRAERIGPEKCGTKERQGNIGKTHLPFEHWEDREDSHPIGVIEAGNQPHHSDCYPLVVLAGIAGKIQVYSRLRYCRKRRVPGTIPQVR